MADFHMNRVPTFPRLAGSSAAALEKKLLPVVRRRPVGVVIPALHSDLKSPAMAGIIDELRRMRFIQRVYISLDRAGADEFREAQEIVAPLGRKGALLWNDSPAVQDVVQRIEDRIALGGRGKGRAIWLALGYVIAREEVSILAFHDADITTYDREFMLRLVYLLARQRYQFVKGYYARHADRLYGRVVRLFYFPFLRALREIIGPDEFLDYMADFRYPLSGEFATFVSLAREMRFPADWGIEVGVLGEMFRIVRPPRLCQVELTPCYDHKHREMGDSPAGGLQRMATEIARTTFTHLASRRHVLGEEFFGTVKLTYLNHAREFVDAYENLSELHGGLSFDLHQEVSTIEEFARSIDTAHVDFRAQAFGSPLIPAWRRVEVALDGVTDDLRRAFEARTR